MRLLPTGLFQRIALLVAAALFLAVASAVLILYRVMSERFLEQTQRINWERAQIFTELLLEELGPDFTEEELTLALHKLVRANRDIDVSIVDAEGEVLLFTTGLSSQPVDPGPIREFLRPVPDRTLPLFGKMIGSDKQHIFSVAEFPLHGERAYLYVVLEGGTTGGIVSGVREAYVIWGAMIVTAVMLALGATLAVSLYLLVTKRFRRLAKTVDTIADGALDVRYHDRFDDELAHLGNRVNEMTDKLVAALSAARENDRLRRELIANVSHDLGGPLTAVQGYLHRILEERRELLPETQKDLRGASANVRMLVQLASELLELSKLEAREKKPEPEQFSITELIEEEIVPKLHGMAQDASVQLSTELPPSLPSVRADLEMIERVLQNLVENAIRYNQEGGTVTIRAESADDKVWIAVEDTGPGIPPNDLPHVFERFYRGDKARTKRKGGTGLGLAIVKQIIEVHGEEIEVASEIGIGTTFRFSLPQVGAN